MTTDRPATEPRTAAERFRHALRTTVAEVMPHLAQSLERAFDEVLAEAAQGAAPRAAEPRTEAHRVVPTDQYGPCRECGAVIEWNTADKMWQHAPCLACDGDSTEHCPHCKACPLGDGTYDCAESHEAEAAQGSAPRAEGRCERCGQQPSARVHADPKHTHAFVSAAAPRAEGRPWHYADDCWVAADPEGAAPRAEGPECSVCGSASPGHMQRLHEEVLSARAERDAIAEDEQAAVDELLTAPRAEGLREAAAALLVELEYWSFFSGPVRKWRFDEVQPELERRMADLRAIVGTERPTYWPNHEPYPRRPSDEVKP